MKKFLNKFSIALIFRLVHGNGISMEILWEMSQGMGWDSTLCISHGTYGTKIVEQEIENFLNKHSDSDYECQNDNELCTFLNFKA